MSWTLPNLLTIARVLAAPLVAVVFLTLPRPQADAVALVLFTAAALTDFLDGYLARAWNQISGLGQMLDPVADKAMVVIALATLMALAGPDPWIVLPAVAILLREVLVSGLREYLGDVKLPVTRLAKWKTAVQMAAIGVLLLAGLVPVLRPLGLVGLWIAGGLTVVTGLDYLRQALPHLVVRRV